MPEHQTTILSVYDGVELEPGWYPVLLCWDAEEGFFPDAAEWSGTAFKAHGLEPRGGGTSSYPVSSYWPVKFENEEAAKEFAYEHDPNW